MKNNKFTFFKYQYSLPKMFIISIILLLIYLFAGKVSLLKFIPQPWNRLLYMAITLVVAGFCAYFAKTSKVLEVRPKQGKLAILSTILVVILVLLYLGKVIGWVMIFNQGLTVTIICLATAIGAGFGEEFIFRNLLFNAFLGVFRNNKYSLALSSITISAIFGLMHLVNLTHQDWAATSQQVFYAFAIGLLFCVIHIWSNTMIVPALMHFLFDFSPVIKTATTVAVPWAGILIIFLPLLVVSLLWIVIYNRKVQAFE
ncbi:membrane protease YdiL (CAAX protease family) [Lactobacillus colini]|uniref:Membrane protease YdiL (CAAX protease family) n=1 Tax=Lactobacillus colini TaxID=1819254 RepID=A0ABS4MD27_9LACO|nr:CPBP family intramembrane glutamic endopeptidase [Lactobacillus colini]MBP2057508.1 membrane protease YdiL (CAAX protease family) [Lactobacillus colini]